MQDYLQSQTGTDASRKSLCTRQHCFKNTCCQLQVHWADAQGAGYQQQHKKKRTSYDWVNVLCKLLQSHDQKRKIERRNREGKHLVNEPQNLPAVQPFPWSMIRVQADAKTIGTACAWCFRLKIKNEEDCGSENLAVEILTLKGSSNAQLQDSRVARLNGNKWRLRPRKWIFPQNFSHKKENANYNTRKSIKTGK